MAEPKRVWLWNLEDDGDELARQISAAASYHGITAEMCGERLFVDSAMDGMGLCTAVEDRSGFRIILPVFDAILTELRNRQIDVLIIDPFVSSHRVDENSNARIDAIAKQWALVAKRAACAIVLVHHSRKLGGTKVDAESARGAGALVNAARSVLVLNRMDPNTATKFRISDEDRRRYFSVEDDKHNRAPPGAADWFRHVSVALRNGGPEGGDSVGVVEHWTPPDPMAAVDADTVLRVQRAIAAGEWRENVQATEWAGRAIGPLVDLNPNDPADKRQLVLMLKQWVAQGVLRVERRMDGRRKRCPFVVVGRPLGADLHHLPGWGGATPNSRADPP